MADDRDRVEFRSDDGRTVVSVGLDMSQMEPEDYDFGSFSIRASAPGLDCDHHAFTLAGDGLDDFLASLVEDWRGWEGVRDWQTLEHGLAIEATHLGNRVLLLFVIRRNYERDAWEIRLPVSMAPGEPLRQVASDTAELMRRQKRPAER